MKKNKHLYTLCFLGIFFSIFIFSALSAMAALPKTFLFPNVFFKAKKPIFSKIYDVADANWTKIPATKCQYSSAEGIAIDYNGVNIPKDGNYQAWADIYNLSDVDIAVLGEKFRLVLEYDPGSGDTDARSIVLALLNTQRVYLDLGYVLQGQRNFKLEFDGIDKDGNSPAASVISSANNKQIALCEFGISESGKVSDVIGVKVFENRLHLSADAWYKSGICSGRNVNNINNVCFTDSDCQGFRCVDKTGGGKACDNPDKSPDPCTNDSECNSSCNFNIANRGDTSPATVDGFLGARSGRTIYVNAANLDTTANPNVLYTNIYLLSYNENASEETIAIFKNLVNNWKFMDNVLDPVIKGQIQRDTQRFSDIRATQIYLRDFQKQNGFYPLWDNVRKTLSGGTYIPGISLSVWPSWKNNLSKQVKAQFPTDPVNTLRTCPDPRCATGGAPATAVCNANSQTCWDEKSLKMACPANPQSYLIYAYQNTTAGGYNLGVDFEYDNGAAAWSDWRDLILAGDPSGSLRLSSSIIGNICTGVSTDDLDNDTISDQTDNCKPADCKNRFDCANPAQTDTDADGKGDVCDPCPNSAENDQDHDGICANEDNCPKKFNPDQKDSNNDCPNKPYPPNTNCGDACDIICQKDSDSDLVCDENDNCPFVFNPRQENYDSVPYRFCSQTSATNKGRSCADDAFCGGVGGEFIFCLTPDKLSGQIWPNGQQYGDACDPNTDHDNDGFATGFCGGHNVVGELKICNSDIDCLGFARGTNPEKCQKLSASTVTRLDNCSTNDKSIAGERDATFNPGQEDYDKDLIGYICDKCIDTDMDGYTDTLLNEGFEQGTGKWQLVANLKDLAITDGSRLGVSSSYAHLDDATFEARTQDDTAYLGIHGAWVQSISNSPKWLVYKLTLPGHVRASVNELYQKAQFKIQARAKSASSSRVQMIVRRACHSDPGAINTQPVPYRATCKGVANDMYVPAVASPADREWNMLEANFYIDYLRSQDEIAVIFEMANADSFYIDDVKLFYRLSEVYGAGGADSCNNSKPDNCNTFNNSCMLEKMASCKDILNDANKNGLPTPANGFYEIYPGKGVTKEVVYCDMSTDGGGWTLVARLQDEDDTDATKRWIAKTNDEMRNTLWFNNQPYRPAKDQAGLSADSNDYKSTVFDTMPLKDMMVTLQTDGNFVPAPNGVVETYAVWANNIGDGVSNFANQNIWVANSCNMIPQPPFIKSGFRIHSIDEGDPATLDGWYPGLMLSARDSQNNLCIKRGNITGINNNITGCDETGPNTEWSELAVIAMGTGNDPGNANFATNPSLQGLGNIRDDGELCSDDDIDPDRGKYNDLYLLISSGNYALLWFREGNTSVVEDVGKSCVPQSDRDEDNIGDACDSCTDKDGDGWGDPGFDIRGCPRSFNVSDNCPITVNTDQKDYDDDAKVCVFAGSIPYKTRATYQTCMGEARNFDPKKCDFCGGDACDYDADGDRCYNWEQTKNYPTNTKYNLPGLGDVVGDLINREEDYLKTGFHEEKSWLSRSSDTDRDSLPDDCDSQACGDAQVEAPVACNASPVIYDQSIGFSQCEECDKDNFGVTTVCDGPNPITGSTGTLREMYPFNTSNINVRFIAHFNDSPNALGRAMTISPVPPVNNIAYDTPAYDLAGLGKSAVITAASALQYPPSSYNPNEGTVNIWVRPARAIANLEIAKDPATGVAQKTFPVNWNANTWHMITVTYGLFFDGPPKIYMYTFYLDGGLQDGDVYLPPLSGNIDMKFWLWFVGLQVDVPGSPLNVALDEFVIFQNRMQDDSVIKAMYDAIINRCMESSSQSITKYMLDNFCASCNNLQCQINVLRMCSSVETGDISIPKVSPTYFLWVGNEGAYTVTQMAALPIDGYKSGDRVHEYRICKLGGGAGEGGNCVNDPAGCPSGYCAVDFSPAGPENKTTCSIPACNAFATEPTRIATNVEDNTALVAYRGGGGPASGVGYFDAYKGLVKFCSIPNRWMRGMVIDKNGNGWTGNTEGEIFKIDTTPSGCPDPAAPIVSGITVYGMAMDSQDNIWISTNQAPAGDNDEEVFRIDAVGDKTSPVNMVNLNTALCNGTTVTNGWTCRWYNTGSIYGIAVDSMDRAWVGRTSDPEDFVYVIRSNETGNIPALQPAPGGLRMGVALKDTGAALQVRMLASKFPNFNVFHMYDYDNAGNISYFGDSDDFTGLGEVMIATSDSEGYIWVLTMNGPNVYKLNFDGRRFAANDTFPTSWIPGATHYIYSDFTGINRAMVFRTGVGIYPPGASGISSFETTAISWSRRWGKVLYDRANMRPDVNDIQVFVFLTDNESDLSAVPRDRWIFADPYDLSRDVYNKCVTNPACEYKGRYMKLRVVLKTKLKDEASDPKISNLRITCKDSSGRNICQ